MELRSGPVAGVAAVPHETTLLHRLIRENRPLREIRQAIIDHAGLIDALDEHGTTHQLFF